MLPYAAPPAKPLKYRGDCSEIFDCLAAQITKYGKRGTNFIIEGWGLHDVGTCMQDLGVHGLCVSKSSHYELLVSGIPPSVSFRKSFEGVES